MTHRLQCCVVGCHRTTGKFPDSVEWICREHWKRIRSARRRAYKRAQKRWSWSPQDHRLSIVCQRLWACVRREAVEKAMGI